MLPSASLGNGRAIYEPIHGSAPDIAGQDIANPIASILSSAMMLKYSFNMDNAAYEIDKAVRKVLEKGYRTRDIYEKGTTKVGCQEMGRSILEEIRKQ